MSVEKVPSSLQIGSDGSVERYPDPYKNITKAQIRRAAELEQQILAQTSYLQVSYLRLARALAEFKEEKLYLARGYPTFRAWAESPDLQGLTYRTAHNLVRIANEVIPLLERNNLVDKLPPVSVMYSMLPILSDENAEEKFIEATYQVQGLTHRDAEDRIKEVRGIARPYDEERPALFTARVETEYNNRWNYVHIWCNKGNDGYSVTGQTPLMVKKEDWPRLEQIFRNYITIEGS